MRVIVAGSRSIDSFLVVSEAIEESGFRPTRIISGGAKGVDAVGEQYADAKFLPISRFNADWEKHGKSAGAKRNRVMAINADALVAIWDGKSPGTSDMISVAIMLGLPYYIKQTKTHELPKIEFPFVIRPEGIQEFSREFRWLSNFWPVTVTDGEVEYPTVEHAYQASKFKDIGIREKFSRLPTARDAKRWGRDIKTTTEDWDEVKESRMYYFLRQKFSHGSFLAEALNSTGKCSIVEGNTWRDRFWGMTNGTGSNRLGKLIMKIREENRRYGI